MMQTPVLVVDDEREMRDALNETLQHVGCDVVLANSGEQGLEIFLERPFKIVITDVKMPGMSGLEFLQCIKERSPITPVIVITAFGSINNAVEAMRRGAFDYVVKPFKAKTLEAVLRRALDGGSTPRVSEGEQTQEDVSGGRSIVTSDPKLQECIQLARHIAPTKATVLIHGESGTGKELFARFIHLASDRRDRPFVAINCAALPEGLLESEMFGHEKGSFTGAIARKIGKFELANHGTILLDEISEMELPLQAKLLRVLQEHEIDRVGGMAPVRLDIRVIATSNRELTRIIKEGGFREDLYYRLNVIPLQLPPLRERPNDIPTLVAHFLRKHAKTHGRQLPTIEPQALDLLRSFEWRGNVRELENVVERAVLLSSGSVIEPKHFFLGDAPENGSENGPGDGPGNGQAAEIEAGARVGQTMREMEKELILKTLKDVDGNRTHAANILGISIRTLRNKLKEYRASGGMPDL